MQTLRTNKYVKTKQTSITAQTIKNKIKVKQFLLKKEPIIKKSYVDFNFASYSDSLSYGMSSALEQLRELVKDMSENNPISIIVNTLTELEKRFFKSRTGIDIDQMIIEYSEQKEKERFNKTREDKDPETEVIIDKTKKEPAKKPESIIVVSSKDGYEIM